MSDVYDDALVEKVARNICLVHGRDPDAFYWSHDPAKQGVPVQELNWKAYIKQAQIQIVSYETLRTHYSAKGTPAY